jgi:hypothetical protein
LNHENLGQDVAKQRVVLLHMLHTLTLKTIDLVGKSFECARRIIQNMRMKETPQTFINGAIASSTVNIKQCPLNTLIQVTFLTRCSADELR